MKDWAFWAVLLGLGMDLVDAITTKEGQAGGALYGPTGFLRQFNATLPYSMTPGSAIATIGAAGMAFQKWA